MSFEYDISRYCGHLQPPHHRYVCTVAAGEPHTTHLCIQLDPDTSWYGLINAAWLDDGTPVPESVTMPPQPATPPLPAATLAAADQQLADLHRRVDRMVATYQHTATNNPTHDQLTCIHTLTNSYLNAPDREAALILACETLSVAIHKLATNLPATLA